MRKKRILKILIVVMVISVAGMFIYGFTHPNSGVTMSLNEVFDDINVRLGSDLQAVTGGEKYYSGLALHFVMQFYENHANRVLENNAQVDRLWYERTGIPPEEARHAIKISAAIRALPQIQEAHVTVNYGDNWQNNEEAHVFITLFVNDGSTLANQDIQAIAEIIRDILPGILDENISIDGSRWQQQYETRGFLYWHDVYY